MTVYDAFRDRLILYGGYDGSARLGQTWEFDGTLRSQATPAQSPGPRNYHHMVFDEVSARAMLFGGHDGTQTVRCLVKVLSRRPLTFP